MASSTRLQVLLPLVLLAACNRAGTPATATPASSRPTAIADAKRVTGNVICPLEIVNGNSIRQSRTLQAGTRASLVGWSRVADQREPVPPMVHVVFRSTVPDGSQDLFWPGVRVPRPEHSEGNPLLANAGWSAAGNLPRNPGKYQVLLWVGNAGTQRECDTHEVLDLTAEAATTLLLPPPARPGRP